MYGWDGGGGAGARVLMALVMMLFWGGLVTVVIVLLRRGRGQDGPGPHGLTGAPRDEAERILNERFARGETDETELAARRAALRRKL
jgi:putative membrane protein